MSGEFFAITARHGTARHGGTCRESPSGIVLSDFFPLSQLVSELRIGSHDGEIARLHQGVADGALDQRVDPLYIGETAEIRIVRIDGVTVFHSQGGDMGVRGQITRRSGGIQQAFHERPVD